MLLAHDCDHMAKGQCILSQATLSSRQWQRTFIRKDLATADLVRVVNTETFTFNAFGTTAASRPQTLPLCKLSVQGSAPNSPTLHLEALGIDHICTLPSFATLDFPHVLKRQGMWVAANRLL